MRLILYLVYHFFKNLVVVSFWFFYEKISFDNKERLKAKGPYIIYSNHPNTMMDPLLAVYRVKRMVHFLANYSLFKSKFGNWFFGTFFCLPIQRKEDIGSENLNNQNSFDQAHNHLLKGGCLYVAPESTSFRDLRVRKLKTGTARIALKAVRSTNWDLDLKLLPIGINYSSYGAFRSKVLVNIGEPILLKDFQNEETDEPFELVKKVNTHMSEKLKKLIIHTENQSEETRFYRLKQLLQDEFKAPPIDELNFYQGLIPIIRTDSNLQKQIDDYARLLEQYNLNHKNISFQKIELAEVGILLIGLPIFIYGAVNHFIAAGFPYLLSKKLKLSKEYESTIKILGGIISFILAYWVQIYLVYLYSGNWKFALIYGLILVPTGLFAWEWWKKWKNLAKKYRFKQFKQKNSVVARKIVTLKTNIIRYIKNRFNHIPWNY